MLSKEEVLRIAELAKIEIADGDVEMYQKDLSAILDFVGAVSKLKETKTKQHIQAESLESRLRKDRAANTPNALPSGQQLIGQAPDMSEGFVKTPRIIKTEDHA